MVQAILEGRKTSTRRIIKPQPKQPVPLGFISGSTDNKRIGYYGWGQDEYGGIIDIAKPPYKIGDILYVRETWCQSTEIEPNYGKQQYHYKASPDDFIRQAPEGFIKWKPSIHMLKSAARIFLKVTDIKVERLQNITEREALKEGIRRYHFNLNMPDAYGDALYTDHKLAFKQLWNSTVNKKNIDKYGWDADPYIWTIEFQRVEKEG
jgi:hypothetical protein